ncbi:MAG: hypothetical protein NTY02_10300 [Acidobacteria bacterium]|nr:hypothetical protein [Acidobacteriota bacterium]
MKQARLGLALRGAEPPPRVYRTGTSQFRYWNATDALARAIRFWAPLLPAEARWPAARTLGVDLDAGVDLNAYYDRLGLCFFHATVRGVTVYSGESPDVLCHELGHAVLDAVRPELWNAASIEAAAFHESFGDITAILSALQVESVRTAVLTDTGGRLSRASRISRLAEQLGWAVRQSHPDAVEPDCLRNAVNSFFYQRPETLPPMAPAAVLSSEPHSFCRVFTAAWLESLAGMVDLRGATPDVLASVAVDAGRLLVGAIARARIGTNYFAQVASNLAAADATLFSGAYRQVLQRAFVGRGILSMASASAVPRQARRAGGAVPASRAVVLPVVSVPIDGRLHGIRLRRLLVEAPLGPSRWTVTSAAPDLGAIEPVAPDVASRAFVEDLLRRGRVDLREVQRDTARRSRRGRATHAIVRHGRRLRLERRLFH